MKRKSNKVRAVKAWAAIFKDQATIDPEMIFKRKPAPYVGSIFNFIPVKITPIKKRGRK